MNCPFCFCNPSRLIVETNGARSLYDGFPLSSGHALVVPRQHVASLFELSEEVRAEIWSVVGQVRAILKEEFHPDGFNIGLNDGVAAGQTVGHAHVHIIPRFLGDIADPRGGIRWIIPGKAKYWE